MYVLLSYTWRATRWQQSYIFHRTYFGKLHLTLVISPGGHLMAAELNLDLTCYVAYIVSDTYKVSCIKHSNRSDLRCHFLPEITWMNLGIWLAFIACGILHCIKIFTTRPPKNVAFAGWKRRQLRGIVEIYRLHTELAAIFVGWCHASGPVMSLAP